MAGSDKPFRLGNIWVDPIHHRLSSNGRSTSVEPKVMRLLLCLAERRGEVVRHQQIRSEVWGPVHVVDGVVARAAYQLRLAAAQLGAAGFEIETLRQVGYRLAVADSPPRRVDLGRFLVRHLRSPTPAWLVASLSLALAMHVTLVRPDYGTRFAPPTPFAAPSAERVLADAGPLKLGSAPAPAQNRSRSRPLPTAPALTEQARIPTTQDGPMFEEGRFFEEDRFELATPAPRVEERRSRLRDDVHNRRATLLADIASRYPSSASSRSIPAGRQSSAPEAPPAPPAPAAPEPPPPDQAST